jgi:hypothetical protein
MACCICDRAGHDEELHGEEGAEILELREQVRTMRSLLQECVNKKVGDGLRLRINRALMGSTQRQGAAQDSEKVGGT